MTVDYLLEMRFCEQPPRLLHKTLKGLASRLFEDLMGRGLGPAEIVTGTTPRRLMVSLKGLPEVEPDREERQLGPPIAGAGSGKDAPSEAALGFAERVGVAVEDLEQVQTERGVYLAATREIAGRPAKEVLGELVPETLGELVDWPLVRDRGGLRGLLSLLDGEVVPFELFGLAAGAETAGHPVLSPERFEVRSFADYRERLEERGIEAVTLARRRVLETALAQHAEELGGSLVGDDELLDALVDACEIPGVVRGGFDPGHLAMPEEVILAALRRRQSAFALRREDGLLPFFLAVMDRADDPAGCVQAGQERAVDGHLVDARFRYDVDRRLTLAERRRRLDEADFHPRLGSWAAKGERVRALVELAGEELGWEDALAGAGEAAVLLKADLTSGIVRDFPSLRGTIGGIFAREEGYVEAVWRAIYEHYRSRPVPQQREGRLVAVADRLDSLVGFFGIGEAPSGSRDPFSLRRLARGLLRILIEGEMELDLDLMAARAVLLYGELLERGAEELLRELQAFLAERCRHLLGQQGFAYDEIEAAEAVGSRSLPDLVARLRALQTVREEPDFRSLVLAAKRIFNIVKDSADLELEPDELAAGAELELHEALASVRARVDRAVSERRYEDGLRSMAELVPRLDRFFADVLVMDENEKLRENRVALLQACRRVFWRVARLQQMTVEKG